ALSENLDQVYNPSRTRKPDPAILKAQDQAADFAGVEPWPLWAIRYIAKMEEIRPQHIKISQQDKTHYTIKVDDIDDEDGHPVPWVMRLEFEFKH
ncbi:MAG: hypothetical protein V1793_02485, partial [Pseudomonadota bacterium]